MKSSIFSKEIRNGLNTIFIQIEYKILCMRAIKYFKDIEILEKETMENNFNEDFMTEQFLRIVNILDEHVKELYKEMNDLKVIKQDLLENKKNKEYYEKVRLAIDIIYKIKRRIEFNLDQRRDSIVA